MTVVEGELLWEPKQELVNSANISKYISWLEENRGLEFHGYEDLWQWSVENIEKFWESIWAYFEIMSDRPYQYVTDSLEMKPGNHWFVGSRVNWAEHIFRNERKGKEAIYAFSETRARKKCTWDELFSQVRILATNMRGMGVKSGDPVCCLMPNIPETVVAMLATISIGAVWSNAAPEFGVNTILDRFRQIHPKWLFIVDGYKFGGKSYDRIQDFIKIVNELSGSLTQVVFLSYLGDDKDCPSNNFVSWSDVVSGEDPGADGFQFERVEHNHPLWILFSSGTTGLPKAIVHSHVGALVEVLKTNSLHVDLSSEDTCFFYTTTGWMMFNMLVGTMLTGASIVLFDGNPAYPKRDVLWEVAAQTKATLFGASPTYVKVMEQLGVEPKTIDDFTSLRTVICSGSPATPETFDWFYKNLHPDIWVTSQSGGTEIAGSFVGGVPILPVYAGEIQCCCLGMDIDSWDQDGNRLTDEVGELVCKKPFPSMPLHFLGDEGDKRYNTSYFSEYSGVWTHGDVVKINNRGGVYIYGRSDSTLNRFGVRIGTSEIYRVVENIPEVVDSLVVCLELSGGKYFMPMFLQIPDGLELTDELKNRVANELRVNCSPRHVPDKFYAVEEIPYTLTGKKLEVPVRKILLGASIDKAVGKDSMRNPDSLAYYVNLSNRLKDD